MGIDVEGERVPLLPILVRLLERDGIEGMPVTDGRVHGQLDDGRLVALPAERMGKLLAIIAEMADAGRLTGAGAMVLPAAEGGKRYRPRTLSDDAVGKCRDDPRLCAQAAGRRALCRRWSNRQARGWRARGYVGGLIKACVFCLRVAEHTAGRLPREATLLHGSAGWTR